MKSLFTFLNKEWTEHLRSGKFLLLTTLFVVFGIMNPAVAKLTPLLLEVLSDSLAQTGLSITEVTITAMDSWVQFFKNIPMALIVFVLLESSIFTKEYQSGTLVLSLTKGLSRYKVVVAKTIMLAFLWTGMFWLCFGITYCYNAYFWDNAIAQNLGFSVMCWWLFGLWIIGLVVFFSTLMSSNSGVLASTAGIVAITYFAGMFPKVKEYMPTTLMDGNSLIYSVSSPADYTAAIIITASLTLIGILSGIALLNRKQI